MRKRRRTLDEIADEAVAVLTALSPAASKEACGAAVTDSLKVMFWTPFHQHTGLQAATLIDDYIKALQQARTTAKIVYGAYILACEDVKDEEVIEVDGELCQYGERVHDHFH